MKKFDWNLSYSLFSCLPFKMHSGDVEIENEVKALVKSAEKETKKLK